MPQCGNIDAQQAYLCMLGGVFSWEQQGGLPPVLTQPAQKFAVNLDEIRFDSTIYRLKAPLQVILSFEDEAWNCEDCQHQIVSFGDTREAALHSFCEDFAVLWEVIANASDDELTADAQRVKDFLISIVQSVEME